MTEKNESIKIIAKNKKARFKYMILERVEAGICLMGTEVKSLRDGKVSISEAFATFRGNELFVFNLDIAQYSHGNLHNHPPKRPRKLLMHRRELQKLKAKVEEKGFTLVPLRIYFKRGYAKVEIALAKGRTYGDKREYIKKRDVERDIRRQLK